MFSPYYESGGVTIYHGDCREILPSLSSFDACVTDPVWPNATAVLVGADRPYELFAELQEAIKARCERLVVHLGCDTDPRLLQSVQMSFLRVCWLRYDVPGYKGRILIGSDVAYVFGNPPRSEPGAHILPGECAANTSAASRAKRAANPHPCPRRLEHVEWLVARFGGESVVDPFMGSGTTLEAAKACSVRAVGIEIEERFCEHAAKRLDQGVLFPPVAS